MLEINNLSLGFGNSKASVPAILDSVSFKIEKNEIVAVVGESGCGKSITAMSIMKLLKSPPAQYLDGEILFHGEDMLKMNNRQLQAIRGNKISMIFQEPLTSLNPVLTIGDQLGEVLKLHGKYSKTELNNRCIDLLRKVKIPSPETRLKNYPGQYSGGMRQRIMIAMAIACNPELLIADEPTTALDVTIQAQILRLMKDIREDVGMSIMLITHDLGVVAEFAERVIVMYAGQIVEEAPVKELFLNPKHPYTNGLLNSIPKMDEKIDELQTIDGFVPSPKNMPTGCRFQPRCPYATSLCAGNRPDLVEITPNHKCRCHLLNEIAK